MRDLDQAIAEWRRELSAGGIKSPQALDELESHLREDVQRQVKAGVATDQAFEAAARRMGAIHALRTEFRKVGGKTLQKLMVAICMVLIAFIVWMSGFTFVQMQFGPAEQFIAYAAVISSLFVACAWRYAVPFLPVIPSKAKRMMAGVACIATGVVITNLCSNYVLPHFARGDDRQLPAAGLWLLFVIAVCSCLGLGLMMGPRDREHWGMERRPAS
jgi:hypothetical protein